MIIAFPGHTETQLGFLIHGEGRKKAVKTISYNVLLRKSTMYIQKYVNGQTGLTAYIYRIIYYLQLKL